MIDAKVALLYGLDEDDLAYILSDTEHPKEKLKHKAFSRSLDPRGFWRVDRDLEPSERHTVRTLHAFRALKEGGLEGPGMRASGTTEATGSTVRTPQDERRLILAHRALIQRIRSHPAATPDPVPAPESVPKGMKGHQQLLDF
jgi:hypothetical protein